MLKVLDKDLEKLQTVRPSVRWSSAPDLQALARIAEATNSFPWRLVTFARVRCRCIKWTEMLSIQRLWHSVAIFQHVFFVCFRYMPVWKDVCHDTFSSLGRFQFFEAFCCQESRDRSRTDGHTDSPSSVSWDSEQSFPLDSSSWRSRCQRAQYHSHNICLSDRFSSMYKICDQPKLSSLAA